MDAILEPVVASSDLPRHVETLNEYLADERARRERFYEEMTEQQKVEFINGEVVLHSPARIRHVDAVTLLLNVLGIYVHDHHLGWVGSEKALVCLTRNDYEPDLLFYGSEKAALLKSDQMKLPAPDFVVEVLSPSTERNDRNVKFKDYATHGVAEYWIIDPVAEAVEQYLLERQVPPPRYRQAGIWTGDAEITSVAVPGFHLPARAVFEREANRKARAALA